MSSAAKDAWDRAIPVRARKTRRSHEIMIPRSGSGGRNINPSWADEGRVARAVARPSPLRSEQGDFHHSALPLRSLTEPWPKSERRFGVRVALGADRRKVAVAIFARAVTQVGYGVFAESWVLEQDAVLKVIKNRA